MKAFALAEIFRGIVAGAMPPQVTVRVGQSEDEPSYPLVVLDVTTRGIGGGDEYLAFELMVTPESMACDDAASTHAELVEMVRAVFLGATPDQRSAARAAVKAAVDQSGNFVLLGRGLDVPADPREMGIEATMFKTPMVFAGTVRVV